MDKPAGDEHMGKWVYCKQHLRIHSTGWCTVTPREKIALNGFTIQEAMDDAEKLGLKEKE